jgi:acetyl/propionyl-CoA carboxylase alpha subunit
MFESVLIANRGEIACRIIRTCRRLGIRTIAVYSQADAGALHMTSADESHCIGPADAASSYLRPDLILAAALAHGARAIHPGYGFLSERIELAELCAANGIAWVGPSPRCIAAMGSKIEAKRLAADHGVPSVPGYHGEDQSPQRLLAEAKAVGFPVLIKASAGGGGRGMRRVDTPDQFMESLATAKAEAKAAFGDDRMLLERFIARPRHLEVQLAGDRHGNLIHVFERECSIQRNYQKLVEEAPASHLPLETRRLLLEGALRLGRAIGYDSLGTVEFILEAGETRPYFLEMNTRLQVEHPVTEMITGLDLVELQLRIAFGDVLPLTQADVTETGTAIELRINAEDPGANFAPQLGAITEYREPRGPGVRVDGGIGIGSEVTPYYDSMLLKLIALAPDRAGAVRRLDAALQHLVVLGVGTNQAFLRDIIRTPAFAEVLTTRFIADTFPSGWTHPAPPAGVLAAAAIAVAERCRDDMAAKAPGPWGTLSGFRTGTRAGSAARCRIQVQSGTDGPATIEIVATSGGLRALRDGVALDPTRPLTALRIDGTRIDVASDAASWSLKGEPLVSAAGRKQSDHSASGPDIVAVMPGLVAQVVVAVGDMVRRGDVVVVQEAMKLMLSIVASVDGTVTAVHCAPGQIVAGGTLLLEIAPSEAA